MSEGRAIKFVVLHVFSTRDGVGNYGLHRPTTQLEIIRKTD
jgi:hypothetical protein